MYHADNNDFAGGSTEIDIVTAMNREAQAGPDSVLRYAWIAGFCDRLQMRKNGADETLSGNGIVLADVSMNRYQIAFSRVGNNQLSCRNLSPPAR